MGLAGDALPDVVELSPHEFGTLLTQPTRLTHLTGPAVVLLYQALVKWSTPPDPPARRKLSLLFPERSGSGVEGLHMVSLRQAQTIIDLVQMGQQPRTKEVWTS